MARTPCRTKTSSGVVRSLRRITLALSIASLGSFVPSTAAAEPRAKPAPATPTPTPTTEGSSASAPPLTADQLKAQQHFQRARELYQAGSYREAVAELEEARELDPKAKDLVFNLGIVNERLGKFDEAIAYFRQYQAMDGISASERARAETVIKRLEGAKREAPPSETTPAPTPAPVPVATEPAPAETPKRGRIDAATITAASLTLVGLGVGTVFGVRALSLEPKNFVTGRDGSYADLRDRTNDAHTSAVVADVAFGVGAVAALATAYLYFGRTKETHAATLPSRGLAALTPTASPTHGGGFVGLGGSFQ